MRHALPPSSYIGLLFNHFRLHPFPVSVSCEAQVGYFGCQGGCSEHGDIEEISVSAVDLMRYVKGITSAATGEPPGPKKITTSCFIGRGLGRLGLYDHDGVHNISGNDHVRQGNSSFVYIDFLQMEIYNAQ
jgi:hypothetical protein